ncbi:MAG TPA: CopG family transcriptional regulator [Terriglobia bacterium]|nr:CopG family transcriptional regulator [Terriglobia bacterium]
MAQNVRATIYFNPKLYRALRIKAAESGDTISALVDRAVSESLREDQIDLEAFEERKNEPSRPWRDVLRDLRRDGLI